MDEALIWWTSQADDKAAMDENEDLKPCDVPEWFRAKFRLRLGRPGRGRLWVPDHLRSVADIDPKVWARGECHERIEKYSCGGIVFDTFLLPVVLSLPGLVTDFTLRRIRSMEDLEQRPPGAAALDPGAP